MPTPAVAIPFKGIVYDPNTGAGISGVLVTVYQILNDNTIDTGTAITGGSATSGSDGRWSCSVTGASQSGRYAVKLVHPTTGQIRYRRPEAAFQVDTLVGTIDVNGVQVAPLAAGSVQTTHIADSAITAAKLGTGAVTSAAILDGTIATGDLADGAVTSAKIADGTIVNADISASAAIAGSKLQDGTVTAAKVAADVATQAELDAHTGASNPHSGSAPLASPNFSGTPTVGGATIWHSGNDGAGSGLDADLLDGSSSAAFATAAHTHSGMCKVLSGSYTGDGSAGRVINTGVAGTIMVLMIAESNGTSMFSLIGNRYGPGLRVGNGPAGDEVYSAVGNIDVGTSGGNIIFELNDTGASAGDGMNANLSLYSWVMFYV